MQKNQNRFNSNSKPIDVEVSRINLSDEGLGNALLELPAIQWIKDHKKQISYGALLFCLFLIFLYRLIASQTAKAEENYLAMATVASIVNNPDAPAEKRAVALADLRRLLESSPNLQAKYDGLIAQQLILEKKIDEAKPYIEQTFSRVKGEDSPYYIDYSKTSIALASGKKEEALKEAYLLHDKMLQVAPADRSVQFGGVLYAFNLIRIALLEKDFQNKDAEKKAWQELQQMSDSTSPVQISKQDFQRVMTHFDNEGAKLDLYKQ